MHEWEFVTDLWNQLEIRNEVEQQQEDNAGWDETTVNMKRLPRYFFAEVLIKASQDRLGVFQIAKEMLDMVSARDSQGVRKSMHMLSMTSSTTMVPIKCRKDKDLSLELYTERIRQVGGICIWQPQRHISEVDGKVDWLQGGPYFWIWGKYGFVTGIKFHLGCEAEVSVLTSKQFTLLDPWDVWTATAKGPKGPEKYKLCELFDQAAGEGPWAWLIEKTKRSALDPDGREACS